MFALRINIVHSGGVIVFDERGVVVGKAGWSTSGLCRSSLAEGCR